MPSSSELTLFDLEPPPPPEVKPLPGMMPGLQRGDTLRGDEPVPAFDASKAYFDEWDSFVREHGRWPKIDDERKPWEYRGWMLAYRMKCEDHPRVPKRWQYWLRTMAARRILDEPIPQIDFVHASDRAIGYRAITKWMDAVDACFGGWSSFTGLVDWFLFALGFAEKPPAFTPKLNEQLYRNVNLADLLLEPADYFGEWLALQQGSRNPLGFYPTPHNLVEMMVRMVLPEGADHRRETVADPCVGTGRMLLHASNYSLRLYGQDINQTVLDIALINGALYCPWLCRPFPPSFFTENTDAKTDATKRGPNMARTAERQAARPPRKTGHPPVRRTGRRKKR